MGSGEVVLEGEHLCWVSRRVTGGSRTFAFLTRLCGHDPHPNCILSWMILICECWAYVLLLRWVNSMYQIGGLCNFCWVSNTGRLVKEYGISSAGGRMRPRSESGGGADEQFLFLMRAQTTP